VYRRSGEYCIIGAGASVEETAVLDWAETYLRKLGREIEHNLARAGDQELAVEPKRFVSWSIVVAMALVASGIGAAMGNGLGPKLLALPGSLFLGVAAFIVWLSALGPIVQFRTIFGPAARCSSRIRFVLATILCTAAIGGAITFAARQHAIYNTTRFDQWGLSFMYPEDWWEVKESWRSRILSEAGAFQGVRGFREFTVLGVGDGKAPDAYLFVTIEDAEAGVSIQDALQSRRRQLEEAQRAGDVISIYKCEMVDIQGHRGIETEVQRSGVGRGHDVHLLLGSRWAGISLVGPENNVSRLNKDFSDLCKTVNYRSR